MPTIPDFCLVALFEAAAPAPLRQHFSAAELIDPAADVDTQIKQVLQRLKQRQLVAFDASNAERGMLSRLVQVARKRQAASVALLAPALAQRRSNLRQLGFQVVEAHGPLQRAPLIVDQRQQRGPFDIIGDVHGCYPELLELLKLLGYTVADGSATPPPGRTLVFVGDLVDRGPDTPAVLRLARTMVERGQAICVAGNHDDKLLRALQGHHVRLNPGLEMSLEQLLVLDDTEAQAVQDFLQARPSHVVLDGGALVVAHAGLPAAFHNRDTSRVRAFALYGDPTGEFDSSGHPIRRDWAQDYAGTPLVVYGHTPVPQPRWLHNTLNLDTGCVFGGALSALRYPERSIVSVPAHRCYATPSAQFQEACAATREQ